MPSIAGRIPLNTAQSRNLRNWSADERPWKTLPIVVALEPPMSVAAVRRAVGDLARRHEALRSRLARDAAGCLGQEVAGVAVEMPCDTVELTEASAIWTPMSVPPEERAARCTLYLRDGQVAVVRLTVSHVFTDVLGAQFLARDLRRLLNGDLPPDMPPGQASTFARGLEDEQVRENTEHWQRLLADAPRSCTYSGVTRDEHETAQVATVPLADADAVRFTSACRNLRVTANMLWVAIVSIVVSRISGQHRQVFRSTYANRLSGAEFGAVAQLAQAVYVPINGTAEDTLRARVGQVADSLLSTYDKGIYDANGLLDWLNQSEVCRGAAFQPAFELNYVPGLDTDVVQQPEEFGIVESSVRIDPPSAKADLVVLVVPAPSPVVQLSARRPVHCQRDAASLAEDCLRVVRMVCAEPDSLLVDVPIEPFRSTGQLLPGHHSGVAIDLNITRELVRSITGVESCRLEIEGTRRLMAHVRTAEPIEAVDLFRALRERQPWWSGTVVPDDVVITLAAREDSKYTTDASA
ncbi:hypothetical protein E1263_06610 [Kribbella antibiotica]|uniref:Condensation domain-containing protein n=1 Tax=Kribbella antibiotica TaxID=190195 RepID=A0A4R4ZTN5_9ACTN|nr:condensation domain-containing protein [Kribbella antibiotica]TDD61696.1 hypothetical protein E1263_06610 [Kribbella antibiotica]